jgi:hypothetical protein
MIPMKRVRISRRLFRNLSKTGASYDVIVYRYEMIIPSRESRLENAAMCSTVPDLVVSLLSISRLSPRRVNIEINRARLDSDPILLEKEKPELNVFALRGPFTLPGCSAYL